MVPKALSILAVSLSLAFTISSARAADTPAPAKMSAAAVVDKNVAARGGAQAWENVHTMRFTGKMAAGGNRRPSLPIPIQDPKADKSQLPQRPAEEVLLPFQMDMARPRKVRLEVTFNGKKAIQVFDGSKGYKLRPFLNRMQVESYTPDELKAAQEQFELDGPLVNYTAKGTKIEMVGMEKVEDHDAYKIKLTTKEGRQLHIWIDAKTFLEAKMEGQPRRLDAVMHPVEIYYRDYRKVNGLMIPYIMETRVIPVAKTSLGTRDTPLPPERITIETVVVNPQLEEARFAKPEVAVASKMN